MKKEFELSGGAPDRRSPRRQPEPARSASRRRTLSRNDPDDDLTPAQLRELRRRVADLEDPIRYLLVSELGPRFALYYNVSEDVYAMNDSRGATLFKRRKAAMSVKKLLGRGIRMLRCSTKRVNGVCVPVLPRRSRRKTKSRR